MILSTKTIFKLVDKKLFYYPTPLNKFCLSRPMLVPNHLETEVCHGKTECSHFKIKVTMFV